MAPILALLGVILWLAFSEQPVVSEAGFGSPTNDPPPDSISAGHEPEPLFLVVVGWERAATVRAQLAAESALRRSLGETLRNAEVVEVRDEIQAATVLEAIRSDARGLSVHLGAMLVQPLDEATERPAAAADVPGI